MGRDIIERLMDFDGDGVTAQTRVKLREDAAIEIFKLRADVQHLKQFEPTPHPDGRD